MPIDVRVDAHIARSPGEVAAYMFDPHHDPDWITGIERVDPSAAPVGVGTETHRVAKFMARPIDYVLRVVGAHPGPSPGDGVGQGAVPDGRHVRHRARGRGIAGTAAGHRRVWPGDAPGVGDRDAPDQAEPGG